MNPYSLSRRAIALRSSAIREILKITAQPDVISFAGGLPSPETFPIEHLRNAAERVWQHQARTALQYGPTEGHAPLREWIAERLRAQGSTQVRAEQVLITTGSQQGLDLLTKVLVDEGSKLLVETPSYLGALQAFAMGEPRFHSMPSDNEGIMVDAMDDAMLEGARLLYCLPNFQNPTGRRLPLARREALVARAGQAGVPIVEDDPYGELDYGGQRLPSLHSMNPEGVVYLGSFSKLLTPGFRLGYMVAPPVIFEKCVQAKQAADLHTPSFTQHVVFEAVRDGFLDRHIPTIRALYGRQCEYMLEALERHMPAEASWSRPEGGMFIWVSLPPSIDTERLLEQAIDHKVAFVPGAPFFCEAPQRNTLRLSFVTVAKENIERGVALLGSLIRDALAAQPQARRA